MGGLAMASTAVEDGRLMPAKVPVSEDSYSGRVAARVRELRERKGWTVADLAERINRHLPKPVANSTVHGWDNGSRKIDPDTYPLLAAVFGMSVRRFLPEN